MAGRDTRLEAQRRAQGERAEAEALREVREAAEAYTDAAELKDDALLRIAAGRVCRVNPELLPHRWAEWVRAVREAFGP